MPPLSVAKPTSVNGRTAMHKVFVKIKFDPKDVWVGIQWATHSPNSRTWDVFICIIPMLPIHIGGWFRDD